MTLKTIEEMVRAIVTIAKAPGEPLVVAKAAEALARETARVKETITDSASIPIDVALPREGILVDGKLIKPREKRFACEIIEATHCGRGFVTICDLAVLQPNWLDTFIGLDKMLGRANSALSKIESVLRPSGSATHRISRGTWQWALPFAEEDNHAFAFMNREVELINECGAALEQKHYQQAITSARDALALFPDSYRAHRPIALCGLLYNVPTDLACLTRSARFVYNHDLAIRKAIPFFRKMSRTHASDNAHDLLDAWVKLFQSEQAENRQLLKAIRLFLSGSTPPSTVDMCSGAGAYERAIALVHAAPRRTAGRVPEVTTILEHPDLARLVHQIAGRVAGDDYKTRCRVESASRPALARLIKHFCNPPTMEQLVGSAKERLEGLITRRLVWQPVDGTTSMPNIELMSAEKGVEGVLRQKHNPQKRPRPNRKDYEG